MQNLKIFLGFRTDSDFRMQIKRPNVRAKQYYNFFYFVDLKEGQKCFPCILIKGDVNRNGIDQCVNGSNLLRFEGFSFETPDLIKKWTSDEKDKEKMEAEK